MEWMNNRSAWWCCWWDDGWWWIGRGYGCYLSTGSRRPRHACRWCADGDCRAGNGYVQQRLDGPVAVWPLATDSYSPIGSDDRWRSCKWPIGQSRAASIQWWTPQQTLVPVRYRIVPAFHLLQPGEAGGGRDPVEPLRSTRERCVEWPDEGTKLRRLSQLSPFKQIVIKIIQLVKTQ